jgi:hypothetical protein
MNENIQARISEYQEHVRHIFGLFITWFNWFVGVNYVGIGWFASQDPKKPTSVGFIGTVFVIQCLLGIMVCLMLIYYFYCTYKNIVSLQKQDSSLHGQLKTKTSMPLLVYLFSVCGGMVAIGTVGAAWLYLRTTG